MDEVQKLDELGRPLTETIQDAHFPDPDGNGGAVDLVTSYRYLDAERATEITAPGGLVTRIERGRLDLVETVTEGFGEPLARSTTYTYDEKIGGSYFAPFEAEQVTSPKGYKTKTMVDQFYRTIRMDQDYGDGVATTTVNEYDESGNPLSKTDAAGNTCLLYTSPSPRDDL